MGLIATVELVREELHDGEGEAVRRGEDVGCGRIISLIIPPRDSTMGARLVQTTAPAKMGRVRADPIPVSRIPPHRRPK